jgi:AcrR family transcriptional regulator
MSPRSAATNASLREATRARILEHALRLFAEHGYAATPVDAIVRAAGISPGLLYHYFPGKQAVLVALFEESLRDVRASFQAADEEPDPSRRLGALLRAATRIMKANRAFWALSYGVRMQRDVLGDLGPMLGQWTAEIVAVLERYLREAGWPEPKLEAALLFAQIDGLHQHFVLDPDHYPVDALTDALVARYAAPPQPPTTPASRRRPSRRRV